MLLIGDEQRKGKIAVKSLAHDNFVTFILPTKQH
jgi:hypothetical protein